MEASSVTASSASVSSSDSPDDRAETPGKDSPTSASSSIAANSTATKSGLDSKDSLESPQENLARDRRLTQTAADANEPSTEGQNRPPPMICVEEVHEVKAEIHTENDDAFDNRRPNRDDEREETRM